MHLILHAVPGAGGLLWPLGPSTWAHWYYGPKTPFLGQDSTLLFTGPVVLSQVQGRNESLIHSTNLR